MERGRLSSSPAGIASRWAYRCSGKGECADICLVGVFSRNSRGECRVMNEVLCFGRMACVAQCTEGGVQVLPGDREGHLTAEEILR